jgi:hypothetical protein
MTAALHQLKSITGTLLSPVTGLTGISEAVLSLDKLFCDTVAFDKLEPGYQENVITNAGVDIAPRWAASCMADVTVPHRKQPGFQGY